MDDAVSPMETRVWSGEDPDFTTGDISPDGRYLTDINWGSGDLQLIDLQTGEARDLTGQGYEAGGYAWMSAFSSDGRRLAVAWYVTRANSHDLRVMNVDGTGSRVLIPASEGHYYVDPVDWSTSDQEILVAIQTASRIWQLVLASTNDGTSRIIKTLGWQAPGGGHDQAYPDADLSPDGKYVAYDYPPDASDTTRDIFAVDMNGGEEIPLVTGPGSDRLLGWLPAGDGILFYSDRSGAPGVWRQRVREGQAIGEPELVRPGIQGLIPLGFTANGYAYGVIAESERVHTAAIDLVNAIVLEPPRPIVDPVWRKSLAADWSPDGSRLAYVAHDPLPDPVETLVVVAENGEVKRRIPMTPALHTGNGTLRWITENQILLFAYEQGQDGIFAVDLQNGKFQRINTPEGVGRGAIKWFEAGPEGHPLFLVRSPRDGSSESDLLAFDVATGEQRVVGSDRAISNSLAVSPDGSELAYLARYDGSRVELRVMSTTGTGEVRTLSRTPPGRMAAPVAWTADGSRLVFEVEDSSGTPALWSVDAHEGEPSRLLAGCCRENDVRIHPQGRRMAFAAGDDRGEVWVMKGF